ncbi:hypothetical protein P4C99_20965, partial [Pontiellaceae bacterium B1224]|nr:hypothetical protein [Pontiellaceae bacterium B1224]
MGLTFNVAELNFAIVFVAEHLNSGSEIFLNPIHGRFLKQLNEKVQWTEGAVEIYGYFMRRPSMLEPDGLSSIPNNRHR